MLGGTFVREHMPIGRKIMHGGAYVHNMPTQVLVVRARVRVRVRVSHVHNMPTQEP